MFVSVGLPEKSQDAQIATHRDFAAIIKKIWNYNQKFINNVLPEKLKDMVAQEKVALLINATDGGNMKYYSMNSDNIFMQRLGMEQKDQMSHVEALRMLSFISLSSIFSNLTPDFQSDSNCKYKHIVELSNGWFVGMHKHLSDLLSLNNNIISEEKYIDSLNDTMLHYFLIYAEVGESCIEDCNMNAESRFVTGRLLTLAIDSLIQQKSFQKKNINGFFSGIFTYCRDYPCKFSRQQFVNAFFAPEDLELNRDWIWRLLEKYTVGLRAFAHGDLPSREVSAYV